MHRFFVSPEQVSGQTVTITGGDVNHIKNVLRLGPGDRITVSVGTGGALGCVIETADADSVTARVDGPCQPYCELPGRIVLFQGLPKSDKMEWIVQKAVELGAHEIVPVAMKNCVMKLTPEKIPRRTERWQAIAENAAKQCRRDRIPAVARPMTFSEALEYGMALEHRLLPYENQRGMADTRQRLARIAPGQSVGVFIGPEGGYAAEELTRAETQGWDRISLGRRILRTETAGLAALAMLTLTLEE